MRILQALSVPECSPPIGCVCVCGAQSVSHHFTDHLEALSRSDTVVQFDVNRRCYAIEQQEKRASEALLAASNEFKCLAELKANANTL
jgi:hypothetical protein